MVDQVTERLAAKLASLRADRGWSLDQLSERSGVSRATLSRLEKADASPTADVLNKLCGAYDFSLSQLMAMIDDGFDPVVPRDAQFVWRDGQDVVRRSVSPAGGGLAAEVLDCKLAPGPNVLYDAPAVKGQEYHVVMTSGQLRVEVDDKAYVLGQGDTLRYRLHGPSRFITDQDAAKYLLVIVRP